MANVNKKQQYGERFRDLCYEKLNSRVYHVIGLYTVSRKKVPLIFLLQLLQILTEFHNFSCTTSQENAKVIGVKIYCHTFIMLLPYRVKVSDTK